MNEHSNTEEISIKNVKTHTLPSNISLFTLTQTFILYIFVIVSIFVSRSLVNFYKFFFPSFLASYFASISDFVAENTIFKNKSCFMIHEIDMNPENNVKRGEKKKLTCLCGFISSFSLTHPHSMFYFFYPVSFLKATTTTS